MDWGAGSYETTAAELEPVARAVVERAAPGPGDDVVDLACGTGNAALAAAARGARVIAVDSASRLLGVAGERASEQGEELDLRQGDLQSLPVEDDAADLVLSVFGVIFAPEPVTALSEIARVLRPSGRAFITAWKPAGPIQNMLAAVARLLARPGSSPPAPPFPWFDPDAIAQPCAEAGLGIVTTIAGELPVTADSPEAYVRESEDHPMALALRPALEGAGLQDEARQAMIAALREANEDPDGLLIHSPYVVHELTLAQ